MIVELLLCRCDLAFLHGAHHRLKKLIGDRQLILQQAVPRPQLLHRKTVLLLKFGDFWVRGEIVTALLLEQGRFFGHSKSGL